MLKFDPAGACLQRAAQVQARAITACHGPEKRLLPRSSKLSGDRGRQQRGMKISFVCCVPHRKTASMLASCGGGRVGGQSELTLALSISCRFAWSWPSSALRFCFFF